MHIVFFIDLMQWINVDDWITGLCTHKQLNVWLWLKIANFKWINKYFSFIYIQKSHICAYTPTLSLRSCHEQNTPERVLEAGFTNCQAIWQFEVEFPKIWDLSPCCSLWMRVNKLVLPVLLIFSEGRLQKRKITGSSSNVSCVNTHLSWSY